MKKNIFREYDIRGEVGIDFTVGDAYFIARGILSYLKSTPSGLRRIILARDGRAHSEAIHSQVVRAFTEASIDVVDIGIAPTPALYFALQTTSTPSGIIITASHNPPQDNGFKIVHNKKSVCGKEIAKISKIVENKDFFPINGHSPGTLNKRDGITPYVDWLVDHFTHLKNINPKIVFDCANAVPSVVLMPLLEKLGWTNSKVLFADLDGSFPNHAADPTVPINMTDVRHFLEKHKNFELGMGFDGDGDRMSPMTQDGFLVPGDQLLAIYSKEILKKHRGAKVIFDVKASQAALKFVESCGGVGTLVATGHTNIKAAMRSMRSPLGGELSCHFNFADRYFGFDDGIYAALRLVELLDMRQTSLEALIAELPTSVSSSEIRLHCKEEDKGRVIKAARDFFGSRRDVEVISVDGVRAHTPLGWGLLRASNTQSLISMRFESSTTEGLKEIQSEFSEVLSPFFEKAELEKHFKN